MMICFRYIKRRLGWPRALGNALGAARAEKVLFHAKEKGEDTNNHTSSLEISRQSTESIPQELLVKGTVEQIRDHASSEHLSRDDARQQFLRILKILPYGNSIFFAVRKIDDPIGLLPGRIILGINKRGVHFFRPVPKEYLHSAELRDIMQFGSSNTAVFFKMRVAGVLHIFQFETKQGEEICVALQTHINDVMLRRYSKARSIASASMQGDISQSPRVPSVDAYEKRLEELTNTVEQSQRKADCFLEELQEKQQREVEVQEELERLKFSLQSERQNLEDIMAERDKYKMLCDEKDSALQDALTMKNNVQVKFEMGLDNGLMPTNKSDVVILTDTRSCVGGIDTPSVYDMHTKLDEELKAHSKDLLAAKETTKNLTHMKVRAEPKAHLEDVLAAKEITKKLANEKHLLEQKVLWLERKKTEEMDILEKKSVQEQEKLKLQISELEKRLSVATQELVVAQSMLTMRNNELDALQHSLKELEELREMREDIDRKNAQTAEILKKQGAQLIELEKLYKEEQYLVQSAVDGYNVCIFAYGQTGSGKTYTIYGSDSNPGLTPRATAELFKILKRDNKRADEVLSFMFVLDCGSDHARHWEMEWMDRTFLFLGGLRDEFESIRSQILNCDEVPGIEDVSAVVEFVTLFAVADTVVVATCVAHRSLHLLSLSAPPSPKPFSSTAASRVRVLLAYTAAVAASVCSRTIAASTVVTCPQLPLLLVAAYFCRCNLHLLLPSPPVQMRSLLLSVAIVTAFAHSCHHCFVVFGLEPCDDFEGIRSHILNSEAMVSIEDVYSHIEAEEQRRLVITKKMGAPFTCRGLPLLAELLWGLPDPLGNVLIARKLVTPLSSVGICNLRRRIVVEELLVGTNLLEHNKDDGCSTENKEEHDPLFGQVYSRKRLIAIEVTGKLTNDKNSNPNPNATTSLDDPSRAREMVEGTQTKAGNEELPIALRKGLLHGLLSPRMNLRVMIPWNYITNAEQLGKHMKDPLDARSGKKAQSREVPALFALLARVGEVLTRLLFIARTIARQVTVHRPTLAARFRLLTLSA
ncbi:hypothetical protein EJ110_NYTH47069 [Nymphaea thermarum]|nr:hypothetical protein EJ110_NYTH47069 [Nymphaea thermarum]